MAIRIDSFAIHDPWDQQPEPQNPCGFKIKIVPDKKRPSFLSAAVTSRLQCNAAAGEASGSNQDHNTLLAPTNPIRYMPGVGFIHQHHHTTSEKNNFVHDSHTQEKTAIPPTPTATRRCNFCKGEEHYASTCNARRKPDADLRYRIVPVTNIVKIYLYLKDGPKEDTDFYLTINIDKDDKMCDTYIVYISIFPMWSPL